MTPITCAVIIIHYSNVQLILIVYNTANTSAQTLIENTDRKMINYRATMSLMSNSEPSPSHSEPLSHMHDGDAPHLFPQSAKKDALNILLMVKCVWKKNTPFFLSDQIPRRPTDQKLVDWSSTPVQPNFENPTLLLICICHIHDRRNHQNF